MIGNLMQKGALRLPEIGSVVQPIANLAKLIGPGRKRVLLASAAGVALTVAVGATTVYIQHSRNLADTRAAAGRVEAANIDLQDELSRLRDQVAASNRDLAAAQSRVVALTEEVRTRAQQPQPAAPAPAIEPAVPAKAGEKSAQLAQQLHVAEAQRATLAARLSKAEADLAEQQAKQTDLLGQIDQWQKKLEQLSTDRDKLRARVGELEKQSALRRAQQLQQLAVTRAAPAMSPSEAAAQQQQLAVTRAVPAVTPAETAAQQQLAVTRAAPAVRPPETAAQQQQLAVTRAAPAATAQSPASQAAAFAAAVPAVASAAAAVVTAPVVVAHGTVDQFARVLASAGVDVRHLFAEFGVNRGEGGPFVPLARGQAIADTALTPEKLAALRAMVKTLPIGAPLNSYEVSSPFGPRGDPEDGRSEFHTGIDLRAPYDSPVYSTAPGTVTYAGYRDDYGKIVEIDHGNGIATRYAHLHAFTVSVGQRVNAHQQIGYLGSTGRATGPHTHYEVVVNGEPQDPAKFINLSRYVPPATIPVSAKN